MSVDRSSVMLLCLAIFGCTSCVPGSAEPRHLDPELAWYGDNAARINTMIDDLGRTSPNRKSTRQPVAVFDWDNTVIKNDVGDATMFWMLRNDSLLQPPGKDWGVTSPLLTPAAATALSAACDDLADAGAPLPTSGATACADEILAVYVDGSTTAGDAAFAGANARTMEPSYAWLAQLLAGRTPDEVRAFATRAIDENLAADEGATQTVGGTADLNGYVRIYPQMEDLIGALRDRGFDVWVVSASPQYVVEPFAARVGIAADHVIGVRTVEVEGKLTADIQGCGPVADGEDSLITYIEGKRCWINKIIYGDTGPTALARVTDPEQRITFGAGDSNTDVSFLQDATALRLVINRNKTELMCNAYADHGGNWLINPMFIAPRPQLAGGYACSRDACIDESGAGIPCIDEAGRPIPDQKDSVF